MYADFRNYFTVGFLKKLCTHTLSRFSTSHYVCFCTTLWNLKITTTADFIGVLHVRSQKLSCNIWGRFNSSDVISVIVKSGRQCSSAQKRNSVTVNWSSAWHSGCQHWNVEVHGVVNLHHQSQTCVALLPVTCLESNFYDDGRAVPNIRIRSGPNNGPNGLFVFGRILPRFGTWIRIVDNCPCGHAAPQARDETQQLMLASVMKPRLRY